MMSSLVNAVLFLALVLTSVCVVAMYRRLKRFEAYQAEYKRVFDQSAQVLGSAGEAVKTFAIDGRAILSELDARIEEAKIVIATLNTSHDTLAEQRQAGVHVSEIGFQNTKVQ